MVEIKMETTRDSIESFYSCADMRSRNKGVVINLRFFRAQGNFCCTLSACHTARMFELLSHSPQLASVAFFLYTFVETDKAIFQAIISFLHHFRKGPIQTKKMCPTLWEFLIGRERYDTTLFCVCMWQEKKAKVELSIFFWTA